MHPALSFESITVDTISSFFRQKIDVDVLRLDKLDPVISGNKWFKLRYYIETAIQQQKKGIITFGGAWSNHIVATAAACEKYGLSSIGIIRGEEPGQLSFALQQAVEFGMNLIFISRADYKEAKVPQALDDNNFLLVNEGGYGIEGARGASTILDYCKGHYTHYCCAIGTGTMMAGMVNRASPDKKVIGISVMKNNVELLQSVKALLSSPRTNWEINHDYSFGGYAKQNAALIEFMKDFYNETKIPTDFVYTGKLFYAIKDLVEKNYFPASTRLLIVHSGGLQGNRSLPMGLLPY